MSIQSHVAGGFGLTAECADELRVGEIADVEHVQALEAHWHRLAVARCVRSGVHVP